MGKRKINLSVYKEVFVHEKPTWHRMAACHGKPTEWWFASEETNYGQYTAAKLVCKEMCPVRWKCLAANLDECAGIFGGFDLKERRYIRSTSAVAIVSESLMELLNRREAG